MSDRAKRELLAQIAPRYREAPITQKTVILDEFIAATGYDRKYALFDFSPSRYHHLARFAAHGHGATGLQFKKPWLSPGRRPTLYAPNGSCRFFLRLSRPLKRMDISV